MNTLVCRANSRSSCYFPIAANELWVSPIGLLTTLKNKVDILKLNYVKFVRSYRRASIYRQYCLELIYKVETQAINNVKHFNIWTCVFGVGCQWGCGWTILPVFLSVTAAGASGRQATVCWVRPTGMTWKTESCNPSDSDTSTNNNCSHAKSSITEFKLLIINNVFC